MGMFSKHIANVMARKRVMRIANSRAGISRRQGRRNLRYRGSRGSM